jgi:hypothetical protein
MYVRGACGAEARGRGTHVTAFQDEGAHALLFNDNATHIVADC